MTEEPLPPEQEAAVRRLLGSAGEAPSLPREVADRLDATLADLVAERAEADPERIAPVVALSSRRRKALAGLFVAAAAVVVAGIGVPLVHDAGTERTASSDTALARPTTASAGAASGAAAGAATPERHPAADRRAELDSSTSLQAHKALGYAAGTRSADLTRHNLRPALLELRSQVPAWSSYDEAKVHAPAGFTCAHAAFGRGYLIGVRYAGTPAVVAFRSPVGSTQVAEVLQCGTGQVLRSVTLPTR